MSVPDHPGNKEETIERKALRGGQALLVRHGAAFLFNFVGGVLLARKLGPEPMGIFYGVFAWFLIGRLIIDFGTSAHIIQRGEEPTAGLLTAIFRLQSGVFLLLALLAVGLFVTPFPEWYAKGRADDFRWILAGSVAGLSVWSFQSVSVAVLERHLAYGKVGLVEMVEPVLFNVAAVTLVWWRPNASSLALALALRGLAPALLALALSGIRPSYHREAGMARALLRSVRPLVGAQVFSWLVNLMPSVLLVPLVGAAPFALVNLAYSLLGSMGFLMGIFQRIAFSSFSRIHDESERLNRIATRLLGILCFVYVPLDLGLGAFAALWVPFVYGEKWNGMAPLLACCAVPTVLVVLASVFQASCLAGSANSLVFRENALNAGLYIGIMALLAKPLGPYAWPAGQLLAVPAAVMFVRYHFVRYGPVPLLKMGLGFLGGVAWLVWTLWALHRGWTVPALVGGGVFVAVWTGVMSRGLRLEELFQQVLGRAG